MNPNQKYFDVLGISPTGDANVIKKAYRKLAFKFHPDKNPAPEAASRFIELTDAYEIVSGVKKAPRLNNTADANQPTAEERIKAAKKRYQNAKQRELEEEAAFYYKLIEGRKWKFIKFMAIVCSILSAILILDFFLPSNVTIKLVSEVYVENSLNHLFISIGSSSYYFNYDDAIEITKYPLIEITKTPIFNDLKYIGFLNQDGQHTEVVPVLSLLAIFPLVPLTLLIPCLTVWYKRPNALFTILHLLSVYFIPIIFTFSLFSNWRIFQIFM